jgi:integrase
MTIAEAGLAYIDRPGGLKSYDLWRLDQINGLVGDYAVAKASQAWGAFLKARCAGLAPATADRFRSVLQAAVNYAADLEGFNAPKIKRKPYKNKRNTFLTIPQQDALLASYAPHVQPIALTLCFQGLRIGEALRLDWQHVRWASDELYVIPETKTGEDRTVSLHERVRKALHRLWVERGSPAQGRVFLNRLGQPYADPRTYRLPGGSPIRKAHETACRRAGLAGFRVHDWRHHWASWCVMSGISLEVIREEGGWAGLRMVERYASVSSSHRAEAMRKRK